ncbi:MAG: alpha/beta hydrolase family esterase, partial [Acidimicrobiia bacterium]
SGNSGAPRVRAQEGQTEEAASIEAVRPYGFKIPDGYDGKTPVPLVLLLHGYTSNGEEQDAYFKLGELADQENFFLAYPDGTVDPGGNRFWNATDACCDFFRSGVDDAGYLATVIDDIVGSYNVDQSRIFAVGHSNGGFMSHRFACDTAGRVAAIVSLAGMQWSDASRCQPSAPVSVLQVHGSDDSTISYDGGATPGGTYPGARETLATWAGKNGCTGQLAGSGERLDLEGQIPGPETSVERYSGCGETAVELWTIEGGSHIPAFNDSWAKSIWRFLDSHPRPQVVPGGSA